MDRQNLRSVSGAPGPSRFTDVLAATAEA